MKSCVALKSQRLIADCFHSVNRLEENENISDTVLRVPKHREGNGALLWLERWSQKGTTMLPSVRLYIWD